MTCSRESASSLVKDPGISAIIRIDYTLHDDFKRGGSDGRWKLEAGASHGSRTLLKKLYIMQGMLKEKPAPLGGIHMFNIQHGFPEALIRGYRSGFMKSSDYHHLTQCDTIEVRLMIIEFTFIIPFLYTITNPIYFILYTLIQPIPTSSKLCKIGREIELKRN